MFKNIVLRLVSASNGGRIGLRDTFVLTISPNDSPHGKVQLSAPVVFVAEDPLQGSQTAAIYRRFGLDLILHSIILCQYMSFIMALNKSGYSD